jgi:hypothetical protein
MKENVTAVVLFMVLQLLVLGGQDPAAICLMTTRHRSLP